MNASQLRLITVQRRDAEIKKLKAENAALQRKVAAYPKLVEYAKIGISALTSERAEQLVFEVEAFLKEIGELESNTPWLKPGACKRT
jgi:hypothetical protein